MTDSDITLYFLNSSRAIRVAWLLQELDLPYDLVAADRAPNGLAPPDFKQKIPHPLGKSPTIKDGNIIVTESGSILEYLCEKYDTSHVLLPAESQARAEVRQWLHAAEGTFMTHGLAILYARWQMPEAGKGMLEGMEERLSKNVKNDLSWLEGVLKEQRGKGRDWLVGEHVTIADIQMQFSILFIFERKLGVNSASGEFPEIANWLERTKAHAKYQAAVEKTGFTMEGDFKK